jgi:hypothetical protein
MATDAEQVEEVREWFGRLGFGLAIEWRDRSDSLPRESRRLGKGYWVDLVSLRTGKVFWPNYASGPTEVLAIIGAEQRYLVEEVGDTPAAPGDSYLDKAEERLRRGGAGQRS